MSGPELDLQTRRELASSARAAINTALDAMLGDRFRRPQGRRPEWDEWLRVSAFSLTERCMRRAANPAQDYIDSTRTARRRVGLVALRRVRSGTSTDLPSAARDALDDATDWPRGLWEWTRQLDDAGRSSVAAAALTWAASLVRLVGWRDTTQWADPSQQPGAAIEDRLVRLAAPLDATTAAPSRVRLLVVADGDTAAPDRLRAGHLALVRALQQSVAPVRVTVAAPARGTLERHTVDEELLQLAVDHVVGHVALLADRDLAPPRVGPGCRHCHLVEVCAEGASYLSDPGVTPDSTLAGHSGAPPTRTEERHGPDRTV